MLAECLNNLRNFLGSSKIYILLPSLECYELAISYCYLVEFEPASYNNMSPAKKKEYVTANKPRWPQLSEIEHALPPKQIFAIGYLWLIPVVWMEKYLYLSGSQHFFFAYCFYPNQ